MIVVCYDISNTKVRTRFAKFLGANGGVRLQMSVFEFNNSKRILDILKSKIQTEFGIDFNGSDSVFVFHTDLEKALKFGNAIHRDKDIVFL